jgi:hypothetical protein
VSYLEFSKLSGEELRREAGEAPPLLIYTVVAKDNWFKEKA